MTAFPKPKRELDRRYLEWIDTLPCSACCFEEYSTHHHVQEEGKGGRGTKCPDRRAIPLDTRHHNEIHAIGRASFALKYNLDYESLITTLNDLYERIVNHDL
jgi:hypothetical protein